MANTAGTALQPLWPYEPYREDAGLSETGDQPALDAPRERRPGRRAASERPAGAQPAVDAPHGISHGAPEAPPIELRQLHAVLNLILEVRAGHQPPARLHSLVHPRVFRLLSEEAAATTARYTLKSVHACRVAPDAIEACGTAHSQGRAFAVVARFERAPQGWHCVVFNLVRPRTNPRRR